MDDVALLATQMRGLFRWDEGGRIAGVNSPDGDSGPAVYLAGNADGVVHAVRSDVAAGVAGTIDEVCGRARGWDEGLVQAVRGLVGGGAGEERHLVWELASGVRAAAPGEAVLVVSGTEAGDALTERLAREVPEEVRAAGFLGPGDFWEPWVVALPGGEIAATAFAARIADGSAEVGVYTFAGFRGRGFAAAVTAAWAAHPELADRALFYSALDTNVSSHRVAERLGLRRIGVSVAWR